MDEELEREATCAKIAQVQTEGKRMVKGVVGLINQKTKNYVQKPNQQICLARRNALPCQENHPKGNQPAVARHRFERGAGDSAPHVPYMEERGGGDVRPRHHVRQERRRPLLYREPGGA